MKKQNKNRLLKIILAVLILALIGVVGYILLREHQYEVSEDYYESLRNIGRAQGGWML